MVRNFGGYSPAFGATAEKATEYASPPQTESDAVEAPKPKQVRRRERKYEIASYEKAVGALVSLALEGQELPLDVSRYLLASDECSKAVSAARKTISTTTHPLEMDHIDEVLADVPDRVTKNVRDA